MSEKLKNDLEDTLLFGEIPESVIVGLENITFEDEGKSKTMKSDYSDNDKSSGISSAVSSILNNDIDTENTAEGIKSPDEGAETVIDLEGKFKFNLII